MPSTTSTRPRIVGVHEFIRADVLKGRWAPGEKLQPVTLSEHYKTSTTVIREALTRLAGEKFIAVEPNRGFFVPTLSLAELEDLTRVRCEIEGLALELAIERGDIVWESALTAAHHQLSRTPRRGPDDPQHVAEEWTSAHRAFHAKLIEACNVPVILEFSRQLADSTELYRQWAAPSSAASGRNVEAEHAEILEATLEHNAPLAAELLARHYQRTVDVVLHSGLVDGVGASLE
ncbi:MAG: GntR family transcriptional regulator [Actinomycetota bacterium]